MASIAFLKKSIPKKTNQWHTEVLWVLFFPSPKKQPRVVIHSSAKPLQKQIIYTEILLAKNDQTTYLEDENIYTELYLINIEGMTYLEYHPFHAVNPQTPQTDFQKTGV